MRIAGRIVIAVLALAGVAACGVVTVLTVNRPKRLARPVVLSPLDDRDNVPFDFEAPGRARLVSHDDCSTYDGDKDAARAVIDQELADADPEEREIWHAELKRHSPETIREILSLRRHLPDVCTPADLPDLQPVSADAPSSPPRPLREEQRANSIEASDDALALIESAIEAVRSGEQVILNNIANANTIGFKRSRPLFGELVPRQLDLPGQIDQQGRPTVTGIALGNGVCLTATQADLAQGRLRHTKQQLDLAIQGAGYFQINDGALCSYTRKGSLGINADCEIVLTSADKSRPLAPRIHLPADTMKIEISGEGIVSVLQTGQTQMNQIGQIQLARFTNPQALIALGEDRFQETAGSGSPLVAIPGHDGLGEIRQGYLEESNVVIADELAELRRLHTQLRALLQLQVESNRAP